MNHPARKVLAVLAILAGLAVLVFEAAARERGMGGIDVWFWSVVAALTILLGLAEFIWPGEKKK